MQVARWLSDFGMSDMPPARPIKRHYISTCGDPQLEPIRKLMLPSRAEYAEVRRTRLIHPPMHERWGCIVELSAITHRAFSPGQDRDRVDSRLYARTLLTSRVLLVWIFARAYTRLDVMFFQKKYTRVHKAGCNGITNRCHKKYTRVQRFAWSMSANCSRLSLSEMWN